MIDTSLLQDFIAETGEHLEELENNLLELEAAPDNRGLLHEIFRSVHTIKGASEYLGMERIAMLTHTLESLLEILRHGDRSPDQAMIDIIIDVRDRIAQLVRDVEREQTEKTAIDDLIRRMTDLRDEPGPRKLFEGAREPEFQESKPLPEIPFPELSFMDEAVEACSDAVPPEAVPAAGKQCQSESSVSSSEKCPEKCMKGCPEECMDAYEEEYDSELFDIFLQHLRENISLILHKIDAVEPSSDITKILKDCLTPVEALLSSANYMDYEKVTKIHESWRNQIQKAASALETGIPITFETPVGIISEPISGMNAYIDTLVNQFPQLNDLMTGRTKPPLSASPNSDSGQTAETRKNIRKNIKTPEPILTEADPIAMPIPPADGLEKAPASDFQGLFDELESVFDAPADETPDLFELEDVLETDQEAMEERLASLSTEAPPKPKSRIDLKLVASSDRADIDRTDKALNKNLTTRALAQAETNGKKPMPLTVQTPPVIPGSHQPAVESLDEAAAGSPGKALPPEALKASAQTPQPDSRTDKAVKQSIRVDARKIDSLMNQVGELVVSRAWFSQLHQEMRLLQDYLKEKVGLDQREMKPVKALSFRISEAIVALSRASNELQEGVMKVRMLPIAQLFTRYPRLVRDLIHDVDKRVHLEIIGEETELDKMVIEEISDPLIHLIRNAVDHGCESAPERRAAGKPEECRLVLQSYHESNHVVIEISDDGRGIDPDEIRKTALKQGIGTPEELDRMNRRELMEIIMKPGFSTAREITKVSGRGVGMDVVRQNVEKLAGTIEIDSRIGEGTRFRIKIPLTLAIIQALLVRVGQDIFTIPLTAVEETLQILQEDVTTIEGVECIYLRNSTLSLLRLSELFGIPSASTDTRKAFVVVVNTGMRRMGLVVDALIGQEETVIKPLADYLQESSGFSGATILGDGRISLILDVYELIKLSIGTHARIKHNGEITGNGEIGGGREHFAAASSGRFH